MNRTNSREYALLQQLQAVLDHGVEQQLLKGKKYQRILTFVGGILVLAAFYLTRFKLISSDLGVVMAVVAGLTIGMGGYIRIVGRILPFIVPHLNGDSIKKRLSSIEQS